MGLIAEGLTLGLCAQVSVCPGGLPTGYTYFIPQEEHLESRVITRGYMEAMMVVAISGRCVLHRALPSVFAFSSDKGCSFRCQAP
jgi:hypothetical protein